MCFIDNGVFFPQFKKILIIATCYMFIVSKQDITKFHLLQIAGIIEPSDIYTDLDTSRIVQGAFSTLYHCEEMPVAESSQSNCHSCCSVLNQLVKDINQLKMKSRALRKNLRQVFFITKFSVINVINSFARKLLIL